MPEPISIPTYWRRTRQWTLALLALWFVVSFGVIFFARELQNRQVFGWPLPFYALAQGLLLFFVALTLVYAIVMQKLNRAAQRSRHDDQERP